LKYLRKREKGNYNIIIDSEIEIERSEYEKNLSNTNDIVRVVKYVPKTKELLLLGNKRTLDGMFKYPVIEEIPESFDLFYEKNLQIQKLNVESTEVIRGNRERNNDIVFEGNDQFIDEDAGFDNNNINFNENIENEVRTPQNISIIEKDSEKKGSEKKKTKKNTFIKKFRKKIWKRGRGRRR